MSIFCKLWKIIARSICTIVLLSSVVIKAEITCDYCEKIAIEKATGVKDRSLWYFEPNRVIDAWNIVKQLEDRSINVIVDVVDSKVCFRSLIKDKRHKALGKYVDDDNHCNKSDTKEDIHGTSIVALMAADMGKVNNANKENEKVTVAGIFPDTKIVDLDLDLLGTDDDSDNWDNKASSNLKEHEVLVHHVIWQWISRSLKHLDKEA